MARRIVGADRFLEVYLSTPLAVCEARDPKGFYKRARGGEIANFTGVNDVYEIPCSPDLVIDTSRQGTHASLDAVLYEMANLSRKRMPN